MSDYCEKVEKKADECMKNLSAIMNTHKASCLNLYSMSASSGHAARFSANLKQLHREQMHLLIDEYYDAEDSDVPMLPSSTVPVSAHPNNDVNVESSGHMMSHLQFVSGSAFHTDHGEYGHSKATVASSSIGQVDLPAGQVGDMTANQEAEEAIINSLVSENVVDVPAHGQQLATVPTAVIPNVDAQAEMATAGNSNANPNIDNVSVKKEIESASSILVSNYNYEEDLDSESVKEEDTDYTSQRCIDVSSDEEEEHLEQQVTNAEEQIQNANSGPAIQTGGAPLTTTVTKAGEDDDTSSDDGDDDSVSVKSEDTSDNCECESDCDSHSGDIEIKEEEDAEPTIDEELAHEAGDNELVQPISTVDFVSLPSTSSGHRRSTRPKKQVNYAAPTMEDSFARKRVNFIRKNRSVAVESESSESSDEEEFVGQQSVKRKGPSSGAAAKKAKHSHVVQQSTVAARPSVRDEPPKLIIKSLNCPQAGCNTVCPDKTSLNNHLLAKHAIQKYRCVLAGCTASFKDAFQLKDHRIGHGNLSDWPCGICSSSYRSYRNLYKHHYHLHEEGLFECSVDDCDFKWTNRCKVNSHLNSQHTR